MMIQNLAIHFSQLAKLGSKIASDLTAPWAQVVGSKYSISKLKTSWTMTCVARHQQHEKVFGVASKGCRGDLVGK